MGEEIARRKRPSELAREFSPLDVVTIDEIEEIARRKRARKNP